MNLDNYQHLALRTAKPMEPDDDLKHATYGIAGEAGELADAVKRHQIYGQHLNAGNVAEELGDLLWYIALACHAINVPMSHIAQMNIDKLRVRYPEAYTDNLAAVRLDKVGE